jgi:uncharacterized protein YdeI (YjbR/CyaY-like superfamily)
MASRPDPTKRDSDPRGRTAIDAPENSVHPLSRRAWRKWLQKHHLRKVGVWVVSYKKATGKPRLEYEDAVEEALCFGWNA